MCTPYANLRLRDQCLVALALAACRLTVHQRVPGVYWIFESLFVATHAYPPIGVNLGPTESH